MSDLDLSSSSSSNALYQDFSDGSSVTDEDVRRHGLDIDSIGMNNIERMPGSAQHIEHAEHYVDPPAAVRRVLFDQEREQRRRRGVWGKLKGILKKMD